MQKNESRFTVFFEGPFWMGVYERRDGGRLEVCKIIFGAEPKDYTVYEYLLQHWDALPFSLPLRAEEKPEAKTNPKRMQREIKKRLATSGVGTKAQQALKLQQAAGKAARKKKSRQQREAEKQRLFALKQDKKKQNRRGH